MSNNISHNVGRDIVAMSGGIDSTALALLLPDADLIFTDTGWEFPELYSHLDKFEEVTGRRIHRILPKNPDGLPGIIRETSFLPTFHARFCTREAKIEPMNAWLRTRLPATLNIGLRADEPSRPGNLTNMDGLTIRYPLREQGINRAGCVALCLENNLLPRYPVYMARGGCQGCFFKRKSEVLALIHLRPDLADNLQALEEEVQDERQRFFAMFPNIGMSIREFRKQPILFDANSVFKERYEEDSASCGLLCHR